MACIPNLTSLDINTVFRENLNTGYGQLIDDCGTKWTKVDPNDSAAVINVKAYPYGALGDGNSHPLSGLYASLALAQVMYPLAQSLNDELDTVAIEKAIATNLGATIYAPTGRYKINRKLGYSYSTLVQLIYTLSLRLVGDGVQKTVFLNGVANGSMLVIDTDAVLKFQLYSLLKDFEIVNDGAPAASNGIEIKKAYNTLLDGVFVHGLTGDGIKIVCNVGDPDISLYNNFKNVTVVDCSGWGIQTVVADGTSGPSWTTFNSVYIARCGTFGVADSGGFKWRGTMFNGEDWCATVCENYGVWLNPPATSGHGNCFFSKNLDLEHNKAKSLVIESVSCAIFDHLQGLNNPIVSPNATHLVYIDGNAANKLATSITFKNTEIRITTTPFTAFEMIGANVDTVNIEDTRWDIYDATGQVRFKDNGINNFHVIDAGVPWPRAETYIEAALCSGNFTADTAANTLTLVGHNLLNGNVVRLTTSGTLPAPLATGTDYVVINKTANTIQLVISPDGKYQLSGVPIDITTTGSGVHSFATTYLPDLRRYKVHKIRLAIGGGAAYVIGPPTTSPQSGGDNNGKLVILDIQNGSASNVAVTFGGNISQTGYTNPTTGLHRSSAFYYNNIDSLMQVGAWSA